MAFIFPNVDPTYIYQRKEDDYIFLQNTRPVRLGRAANSDGQVIKYGKAVLTEVPWFQHKVKAFKSNGDELVEITEGEPSANEFIVDYSIGLAFTHESLSGQSVTFEYYGTGYVSISADRIWMDDGTENPVDTLQDALEQVDEGIEILGEIGDLTFRKEFSPTANYRKWNFVSYNNKTYVALEHSTGEFPSTSDKWGLVSSGVDFASTYDEDQAYSIGDIVSDASSKSLYVSNIDSNSSPLSDSVSWTKMISFDGLFEDVQNYLDGIETKFDVLKQQLSSDINTLKNEITSQFENLNADLDEYIDEKNLQINQVISNVISAEDSRKQSETQRQIDETERANAETNRIENFNRFANRFTEGEDNLERAIQEHETVMDEARENNTVARSYINQLEPIANDIGGFKFMQDYSPDTTYQKNNMVYFDGEAFIALNEVVDEEPNDSPSWMPFTKKGQDGTGLVDSVNGVSPDENGNVDLGEMSVRSVNGQVGDIDITPATIDAVHINDLQQHVEEATADLDIIIGSPEQLETKDKENLVLAINELVREINTLKEQLAENEANDGETES
ncbi:hypothetical protein GCM10008931_42620 [Oceanobacillus oncorhynchi subsp. oncorhynchi]|uniref:hypothetical protein n=1 Tax=Oceanobacillus oncorhynchi TaxID=545501 RepID=UPI0031E043DD